MDVALSIIGKVFKNNFVKNKVLEFVGPGVSSLSMDFRNGIDTMTTESACLSSLWSTDEKTEEYLRSITVQMIIRKWCREMQPFMTVS